MLSATTTRGLLVDQLLPAARKRPAALVRTRLLIAAGVAFSALALWLALAAATHQSPTLAGLDFGGRTLATDVLLGATLLYGLALSTALARYALARDVTLIASGALLLALCAQITIPLPFTPVPITGQTFAVLVLAAALGWRRGVAAVALYIALGVGGLPVFADISSAAADGYLAGFLLAALVVGWLAERGWDRRPGSAVAAMLAGEIAIYVCGLAWLAGFVGWAHVVAYGLLPFIAGDAIKLLAAALLLPAVWRVSGRHVGNEISR
jgi:biotin transport system substrate-specific component